ncbi:polymer-forming cytoskeletal protein [Ottowia sp.]|uniref:bactofilin family protein n=1 Tax=Ottowia sp. TaxID=1898956 RepID=UPI002C674B25|nr:polymer-forming cytoskeletal protein [Ottowia sp.]HRN76016.1 polymer-forming cytoskeletal protein [Ottowia sp.]HRQ02862.1 polymer-forming cytoskeletal protein [Ottowia sp.]
MALQGPFFGKREEPTAGPTRNLPGTSSLGSASSLASAGSAGGIQPPVTAAPSPLPPSATASGESEARLIVGPNIKLKGVEITDCDTVVIEGTVEATIHSRVLEIAEPGIFKGDAEIDVAEIHGQFDGNLTARQKLVIHASGKVTGKVRYGKIVIEEGGQISGEVTTNTAAAAATSTPAAAPASAKGAKGEQLAVA